MKEFGQPKANKEEKEKTDDKGAKQLELNFSVVGKETNKKEVDSKKQKNENKEKAVVPELEGDKTNPFPTAEVSLLKRFVNLNGKTLSAIADSKTSNPKNLLNSLQNAIIAKKIRKSSEFAEEIMQMQKMLIQLNTDIDKKKISGKDIVTIDNADKSIHMYSSYSFCVVRVIGGTK